MPELKGQLKHSLRYGTWYLYEGFYRTKLEPHELGDMKLTNIGHRDVQDFIDDHQAIYKPSSLRRLGSYVSMPLERATTSEIISANPVRRVQYLQIPETEKTVLPPALASELQSVVLDPRLTTLSGSPMSPDTFARDFREATSNTKFKSVKLHDLRASYITILLESGVDIRTVQELAGHDSSAITQEVYARSRRELKQKATATLGRRLKKKGPKRGPLPIRPLLQVKNR